MAKKTMKVQGFSCSRSLSLLLQLLLATALWERTVHATPFPEVSASESDESEAVLDQLGANDKDMNKRAWQSLQTSWGKRAGGTTTEQESIYVTGHFVPLLVTDGENTMDWNSFQQLAKGQPPSEDLSTEPDFEDHSLLGKADEKRTWKNMNVAWGKRRQAQNWNKFRGAWGKREPAWNNLKGMWGKRDQWQKLHGGWGKRSASY